MSTEPNRYTIRPAEAGDLDVLVQFEIEIARVSFPDAPVIDPEVHRKKLSKALERDREGMFVAVGGDAEKSVVGWLWVALNTNFLTGQAYATFRSLATTPTTHGDESAQIADSLFAHGIEYANQKSISEITGKVHVNNIAMRLVYRKFGFTAEHLTMKRTHGA